jgi:hypothetical protein
MTAAPRSLKIPRKSRRYTGYPSEDTTTVDGVAGEKDRPATHEIHRPADGELEDEPDRSSRSTPSHVARASSP